MTSNSVYPKSWLFDINPGCFFVMLYRDHKGITKHGIDIKLMICQLGDSCVFLDYGPKLTKVESASIQATHYDYWVIGLCLSPYRYLKFCPGNCSIVHCHAPGAPAVAYF